MAKCLRSEINLPVSHERNLLKQLSTLSDPERLDEIETALAVAAENLASFEDAVGEAKAHTVRAGVLARLGRIGDAETALDQALTAARRAREDRRVNAVLAGAPHALGREDRTHIRCGVATSRLTIT